MCTLNFIKKLAPFVILFVFFSSAYAQEIEVSGYVKLSGKKEKAGDILIEVKNKEDDVYTYTNDDGFYTITVNKRDTLVLGEWKYEKQEVVVKKRKHNIKLKPVVNDCDSEEMAELIDMLTHKLNEMERDWYEYKKPRPQRCPPCSCN